MKTKIIKIKHVVNLLHSRVELWLSQVLPSKIRGIYEESTDVNSGVELTKKEWIFVLFFQKLLRFVHLKDIKSSFFRSITVKLDTLLFILMLLVASSEGAPAATVHAK